MSNLKPYNDYMMVEVERNPQGFIDTLDINQEGVMYGRVVAISDEMSFFGFNTFMFDSSLMNKDLLKQVYDFYKGLVGKRVYWPLRTESGATIKVDDAQYVFIKMSAVMAVDDEEIQADDASDMWPIKEGNK